jgi:hypothetical protein
MYNTLSYTRTILLSSSVSTVTGYRMDYRVSVPGRGNNFSLLHSDRRHVPVLLDNGYLGLFPQETSRLVTHKVKNASNTQYAFTASCSNTYQLYHWKLLSPLIFRFVLNDFIKKILMWNIMTQACSVNGDRWTRTVSYEGPSELSAVWHPHRVVTDYSHIPVLLSRSSH